VTKVDLDVKEQRVDVLVGHPEEVSWPCPKCKRELCVYDHVAERVWRHLDSCQFRTFLRARPPRVSCPEHGVLQVALPWAEPHARFTMLFERFAIDVLQETNVLAATRILRISWNEAWHLLERAVKRGRARKGTRVCFQIGVDETAFRRGHRYATIVCDLKESAVEYVAEERRQESLDGYFKLLSEEQRAQIEAVAMDMWEPYVQSVREHVPQADDRIVFDRFHIMKQVTKAVDFVRRREHRELRREGDPILTGTKYLWLRNEEDLDGWQRAAFEVVRDVELKTGRAWAIKESLRSLWGCVRESAARAFWKRWYFWATHSRLKPIIEAARTLQRHLQGVMNYFRHPITNAVNEGLNSKIQTIKKMATGFRNFAHFKIAIYFRCGGLDLYPRTH
jgi:transposase